MEPEPLPKWRGFFKRRLFGSRDNAAKREIRAIMEQSGADGELEESEKEMINNIFEFDDRTVGELMTHRTEIEFLLLGTALGDVVKTALESGYSRIPVCEETIDDMAGILNVKDLLGLVTSPAAEFSLKDYLREPLYVLESNTCMDVLGQFKQKKMHMAVVVDEYGGTAGIVTMEDLLESIVGNIQDEYDDEEEEISPLGDGRYMVDGLTSLTDIDKHFDLGLSEDGELDTIGGYVINQLGRIPGEGEHPHVETGGYRFVVSEMDERRVAKITVEKTEKD
jgi:putative hemolysin